MNFIKILEVLRKYENILRFDLVDGSSSFMASSKRCCEHSTSRTNVPDTSGRSLSIQEVLGMLNTANSILDGQDSFSSSDFYMLQCKVNEYLLLRTSRKNFFSLRNHEKNP